MALQQILPVKEKKKKKKSTYLKLLHRIEKDATILIFFNESSITLMPKLGKSIIRKENYRPI